MDGFDIMSPVIGAAAGAAQRHLPDNCLLKFVFQA